MIDLTNAATQTVTIDGPMFDHEIEFTRDRIFYLIFDKKQDWE